MTERLTLKWGTVKGWSSLSEKSVELMKRYFADGVSMSAMADHPNADRRAILCELIDQLDGEVWSDWTGEKMTKEEAKKYVMEYGNG
jgi:hypothetical protein